MAAHLMAGRSLNSLAKPSDLYYFDVLETQTAELAKVFIYYFATYLTC